MIDPTAYLELHKRTEAACQRFTEEALAVFEELRKIDPELAQFATHAYGRPYIAAMSFAEPLGRNRKSVYAELAAGEREEVRSRILGATHGIF